MYCYLLSLPLPLYICICSSLTPYFSWERKDFEVFVEGSCQITKKSQENHSSLFINTRIPAFSSVSIPCFLISLAFSFRGTLSTLTFFFWRVEKVWCLTTWFHDLLACSLLKDRSIHLFSCVFLKLWCKKMVSYICLSLFPPSYHLSFLPSFIRFLFLACTFHRSKSHASLKLWW
jgi:hypothetical protein